MNKFTQIITRTIGDAKMFLGEHAPEILTGIGVVSVVAGTVMACKATLKLDDILEEAEKDVKRIQDGVENEGIEYSEDDADKDRTVVVVRTAGKIVKNYAVPASMIVLGLTCVLLSHKILRSKNAALVASYSALQAAYTAYRQRVIEKEGPEADDYYRTGIKKVMREELKVNEKTGSEETVLVEHEEVDRSYIGKDGYLLGSPYARIFDADHSTEYDIHDPLNDANFAFLRIQEGNFNQKLQRDGHVFLNDVLKELGFKVCPEGQLAGWYVDKNGFAPNGDGYISFGIRNCYENPECADLKEPGEFKRKIVLDFNVDGNILQYIGSGLKNELTEEDCCSIWQMRNK